MAVDLDPIAGGLLPLPTASVRDGRTSDRSDPLLSVLGTRMPATEARFAARRWLTVVAAGDYLLAVGLAISGYGVGQSAPTPALMFLAAFAAGAVWVTLIAVAGGYDEWSLRMGRLRSRPVFDAGLWACAAVVVASYGFNLEGARHALAVSAPLAVLATLLLHRVATGVAGQRSRSGLQPRSCVVGGSRHEATALLDHLRRLALPGVRVAAVWTDEPGAIVGVPSGAAVYSMSEDVLDLAARVDADTVIAAGGLAGSSLRCVRDDAASRGIDLIVAAPWVELVGARSRRLDLAGLPMLAARPQRNERLQISAKRALDCAVGASALLLLAPVMGVIAIAVRLCDGGPVLYRQTRVGQGGSRFTLLKFRSMYTGADRDRDSYAGLNEQDGPLFKIRRDPRITPVGRLLRRLSLDELPQLINVLSGSMSLVGPRPPLPCEVHQYDDETRRRLTVQPGITGLWQVSGRSTLSWADSVHYDLHYVDHWTIGLDMRVLWRTARAVVSGRGAY